MKTKTKWIILLMIFFLGTEFANAQTNFVLGGHNFLKLNGTLNELIDGESIIVDTLDVIIKFKSSKETVGSDKLISQYGFTKKYVYPNNRYKFHLPESSSFLDSYNTLLSMAEIDFVKLGHFREVSYLSDFIIPDDEHHILPLYWELEKTSISYWENTWGDPQQYAWSYSVGNPNIIVAILDDGLTWADADFTPDNQLGYDYYSDDYTTEPVLGHVSHGTTMASIIAGKTANQHGLCGIAGGYGPSNAPVTLMIQRVASKNGLGQYLLKTIEVPQAIYDAVEKGARIINMSWGGQDWFDDDINDALDHAVSHDVILIAAAGNEGESSVSWPASKEEVIAVSATTINDTRATWNPHSGSNTGIDTEIAFPGMSVEVTKLPLSTITGPGTGTSISSAMASGVAALMLSVNPCLTAAEVRSILRESCEQVGPYDYNNADPDNPGHSNELGYGRVNAFTAVRMAFSHDDILITENEVVNWNQNQTLTGTVTIKSNGILNIENCEITAHPNSKIIVERGAKLTVNNAVLKNYCNAPWQGIEVHGNSSANQWPDANGNYQQGRVVLTDAVIENAVRALDLWNPGHYSQTGGIVHATGTTFRNNAESVHALLYRNSHPINEREMDYNSSFSDCNFEITADYNGTHTFYKHVDLNQVNGIKFKGCDFSLSSAASNIAKFNQAIAAYSAGFKVEAICINPGIDTCDYNRSTFTGFYSAIYAGNGSNLSYTFSVNRADFTNNSIGIEVNNVKNHSILLCNFKLGPNTGDAGTCSTSGAPSFGIDMVESNSYIIEENNFSKNEGAPQGLYVGIRCKDSKTLLDVIYRNSFNGLSYGNYAEGLNRSDPTIDNNGLQFMCNFNQNNAIDFIVAKKDEFDRPMIHTFQGSLDLEAKNTFSANPLQYGHFRNNGRQVINYFYNTNPPQHYTPVYMVPVYVTTVNQCPSNYGGSNPKTIVLNESQKLQKELDFANNLSDYNSVKFLFDNLKDGGDTEGLKLEVSSSWPQDMWELRAKLLGDSPHLSEEVLKLAADKTDVLPESVLFEILSANPDELRKETLIEYLENKEQPLPEYMISILKQLAGGITYKTVLKQDMAKYEAEKVKAANDLIRSSLNDSYLDLDYLRNWYDNLNNLNADYEIVASYLTEKNYSAASAMLDVIPAVRNLTGNELDEFNEYKGLILWQIQLIQQGEDITSIDDTSFEMLLETAENGASRASMMARALLDYGHGFHFEKCLSGSEGASLKTSYVDKAINENGISIKANPNPASSWVGFEYELPFNVSKGEILVTDMHGRTIVSFKVTGNVGQQVWDTRQIEKGIYIYTLKVGNISKQGKLVVQ